MRVSIRVKFVLIILGLLLVTLGVNWALTLRRHESMERRITARQQELLHRELQRRALYIFSMLTANAESLAVDDYLTLNTFVRQAKEASPDVRYIHLVQNGKLVVPIPEDGVAPDYAPVEGLEAPDTGLAYQDHTAEDGEPMVVVAGPIVDRAANLRVGFAYVGFSSRKIVEELARTQVDFREAGARTRWEITALALGVLALGFVSSLLIVPLMIRPIRRLAASVRRVGEGDLEHRATRLSNDEVGDLADHFNDMVVNLKKAQEDRIEKERMKQEMEVAMEIQRSLFPQSVPKTPGFSCGAVYAAAREVGGDYYDFIHLDYDGESRLGIVVADVTGKGVGGAIMMAETRSVMRAQIQKAGTPAEALKLTNSVLLPDMQKGIMFVTMFYGMLDWRLARMEICNAGHNPTMVYRAARDGFEKITLRGKPLGVLQNDEFDKHIESAAVALDCGDILVQYTDGVGEAANAKEEAFGMDRFLSVIRKCRLSDAQVIADRVLDEIGAFAGGWPQSDDITVVIVKRA
ncbi:MAG: hypothetical protein A3G34_06810 [Candidatus Lindowbacteria bacterium RIFCSPLOWO2_12_FULL_62_27]|nr:MAG: hypothetical protein A3G34_06810 [Candidatus Lindowbacteria bacterium RIFCSPLOWO2_12_FULL_62_27]OGH62301.1 MAG: hypothetical protein A3I06_14420 [Candidatus Lindowbacteria bacterium RIFCSPLOWO2_02_FULL_62_12]